MEINFFSDEERDEKLKRKKEKELKDIYKVSKIWFYFKTGKVKSKLTKVESMDIFFSVWLRNRLTTTG